MVGVWLDRWGVLFTSLSLLTALGGCALSPIRRSTVTMRDGRYVETGVASWYGPGFHGGRTSSGEVYDSHDMTAAHPALPLGTRVRVTNLDNGRSTEVRINDRGPFAKGRVIDLSFAAASELDLVGPGTAEVRIETLPQDDDKPKIVAYAVQTGAYRDAEHAESVRRSLATRFDDVYLMPFRSDPDLYYRVRLGPYGRRDDASARAEDVSRLGLPAVVVEEAPR